MQFCIRTRKPSERDRENEGTDAHVRDVDSAQGPGDIKPDAGAQ